MEAVLNSRNGEAKELKVNLCLVSPCMYSGLDLDADISLLV